MRTGLLLGASALLLAVVVARPAGIWPFAMSQEDTASQSEPSAADTLAPAAQPLVAQTTPAPSASVLAAPAVPAPPRAATPTEESPTGAAEEPAAPAATTEAPSTTEQAAQAVAAAKAPKVDETALRYFAAKGDTKRLEAEIARLRALYPDWTPPENPLAAGPKGDPKLDEMWKLYSDGKLAELRKAISDRQTAEPQWAVPADLLDRLAVAEAREQLVNASDIQQYDTVIRLGSTNPSLLTCGDVDVLWRVAEAFAKTERPQRARDAYLYILRTCDKSAERIATLQKALPLLQRADIDQLLALERKGSDGKGEFDSVRIDISRQSLAAADADPKLVVPGTDVAAVEKVANEGGLVSDYLLLGWYYVQREMAPQAETWFRKALDKEETAGASQGLAMALVELERPGEAEDLLYKWRDTNADIHAVYLAAVANLLAETPPPPLTAERLQRIVKEVVKAKDAASAQQLGWYADGLNQFETAEQWFITTLRWKPDDEPSAYGLALMRWKLGDRAGVAEVQRAWAGRSERIPTVGQPSIETAAVGKRTRRTGQTVRQPLRAQDQVEPQAQIEYEPQQQMQAAPQPRVQYEPQPQVEYQPQASIDTEPVLQPRRRQTEVAAVEQSAPRQAARAGNAQRTRGCSTTQDPGNLRPQAALTLGWCLMEINRPVEAVAAFERALAGSGRTREDAAYGQSLAYLRAGLPDMAAVSAAKAPMGGNRDVELRTALLSSQATSSYEQRRYTETLIALDELSQIAPERVDLMMLRGYAYLNLGMYGDAKRVFEAVAATGNHEGRRGLGDLNAALHPSAPR